MSSKEQSASKFEGRRYCQADPTQVVKSAGVTKSITKQEKMRKSRSSLLEEEAATVPMSKPARVEGSAVVTRGTPKQQKEERV